MKTLQKLGLAVGLMGLLYSCQSTNKVLSKSDKRMEIMNTIANDDSMSKEMTDILMNSKMGKMRMHENEKMMMKEHHAKMMEMMKENPEMMKEHHEKMIEMMKEHPEMMKSMMSEMMNAAQRDTTMMSGMCKAMMGNEKMMDMMHKMKGEKMNMKKMDSKPKKEVDHKSHHQLHHQSHH